jgi:copper chaperone CopZ
MMNKAWCRMILAVGVASGCATTDGPVATDQSSGRDLSASREVVLTVHGLSCPLCANNLDGQLANVDGVEGARIDLKTGAVTVRLAEGHSVTSSDLAGAVKNAGFTLKTIDPQGPDR